MDIYPGESANDAGKNGSSIARSVDAHAKHRSSSNSLHRRSGSRRHYQSVTNGGTLNLSQSFATTAANQTATTVTGTGANDGVGSVVGSDLTGNGNSTYLFSQSYNNSVGSYSAGTVANGDSYGLVASYVVDLPTSTTGAYISPSI